MGIVTLVICSILACYPQQNLSRYSTSAQRAMVYRAYGEAGGEGRGAVEAVIGTMICRIEHGYGSVDDILLAYYAQDVVVSDKIVSSYGQTTCNGFKYALSRTDIENLGISDNLERECYGNVCVFRVWRPRK